MGAKITTGEGSIKVFKSDLKGCLVDTAPFPGFPTDAQAQMIALCTQVKGASVITEHIFENRFMHVPELVRLGADITLKGKSAFIQGGEKLTAAPIMCTDLRASAALIIAALATEGETEIQRIYHLDRGYENLVAKFSELGAKIKRVPGSAT
jgi:UDP-N-acetylglucosamine 1-carboxyvinyltransferase